jgi:GSCFA family
LFLDRLEDKFPGARPTSIVRMRSPYESLPSNAFWRTGVVGQLPEAIDDLYRRKFPITRSSRIATAGSCFAQHISKHLQARGFPVIDEEPPPPGLDAGSAAQFGYGLYSARYANIFTSRQLLQVASEACGRFCPADPVWEKERRYYDAMRPSVEPEGLSSPELVLDHRAHHLRQVLKVICSADIFVFTLGLTETWTHGPSGTAYPTAPGTIAGSYDSAVHRFCNLTFRDVYDDMTSFFDLAKERNPDIRFLLTVSPVPLTATASGEHVLSATIYSKSVLRAVAGQLFHERENVDYFPSYEIITGSLSKAKYFEANLRSVRAEGVEAAMSTFFAAHDAGAAVEKIEEGSRTKIPEAATISEDSDDDVVCEEVLLEAFSE